MELISKLKSKYFAHILLSILLIIFKVSLCIYIFGCGLKSCIDLLLNTDFRVLNLEYSVTCGVCIMAELKPPLLLDAKRQLALIP